MAEPAPARYTYRVEWSSRRAQYVARCLEMPSVSDSADTAPEVIARAERAVTGHLEYMDREFGGDPPTPLTDHNFSGTFLVRTSPELHARLSTEAAEQGVSLNQWAVQRLANRPPSRQW
ncbi:type II toxin-antitoxin system HicB family antitoxin [Mycolicibacterium psychrotolerans]|uniref:Antitoxin HicB n=1 Tax=Mycolicibacterium psychrotolerans TaxID=216929 RepID=A0A7I7MBF6_9MYCO|nr:type II toxin-antitoxin system HicB family antitoxin [Mycolicibacterium psychrotolerans]BBX69621.1 antitoxin HicB [Mycolicibacterium psychrotolerans]